MINKYKTLLLCILMTTCFYTVCYASTEKVGGSWYMAGFLGPIFSAKGDTNNSALNLVSKPAYDAGYQLGFNIGYKFDNPFRLALDLAYQDLPMDKITNAIPGITVNLTNSQTRLTSLLANGYYDFGPFKKWLPYVGVGLGYVNVQNTIRPAPAIISPVGTISKKTLGGNTFGYQFILGITYRLRGSVDLEFNYKYFSTINKKETGSTNLGKEANKTEQKISNHLIGFGVRYYFN